MHPLSKRGQTALEYLLLLVVALIVVVSVMMFMQSTPSELSEVGAKGTEDLLSDFDFDDECTDGEARACPKREGVCSGSREYCIDSQWPGCDDNTYRNHALDSDLEYEEVESICDSQDNDCDGGVDTELTINVVCDTDNDGFTGTNLITTCPGILSSCEEGVAGNDCDDYNDSINPDMDENCTNGVDDDCDGKTDDQDTECGGTPGPGPGPGPQTSCPTQGCCCDSCESCEELLAEDNSCTTVYLTGEISVTDEDCITIQSPDHADGKTLDCQGNTIGFSGSVGNHHGASISTKDDFTITDCVVEDFPQYGIEYVSCTNSLISGNVLRTNGVSIGLNGAGPNEVSGNTIEESTANAIGLFSTSGNFIDGNIIIDGNTNGIFLNNVDTTTVSNNRVTGVDSSGIQLSSSTSNIIDTNIVSDSGIQGIHLFGASDNVIQNNVIDTSLAAGIYVSQTSTNNQILSNSAESNNHGIYVFGSQNNIVTSNTFCDNADEDLWDNGADTNSGDENTCDVATAWYEDGVTTTGCTYSCDGTSNPTGHLMSDWEEANYGDMEVEYDCDTQDLRFDLQDDALKYYIFTDDILLDETYTDEILFAGSTCQVTTLNDDVLVMDCGPGCTWTFEDDEAYTVEAAMDDDGIWELDFNGGESFTVSDLAALESAGTLYEDFPGYPAPLVDSENYQAAEYSSLDPTTRILRYLEFSLEQEANTELSVGESIGFPFNDGTCFTNTKSFTYNGLSATGLQSNIQIDTSGIDIVKSDGSEVNVHRKIDIGYADQWGNGHFNVRLDEGPFQESDKVLVCDKLYRIDSIEYNDTEDAVIMEYSIKAGSSWTEYEKDNDNDPGAALLFDTLLSSSWNSVTISSMVSDLTSFDMTPGWEAADPNFADALWIIRTLNSDDEDDWEIWLDKNNNGVLDLATTCANDCCASSRIPIVFGDSGFCAYDDKIVFEGDSGTGAEDEIMMDLINGVSIMSEGCVACELDDSDCEDFAEAQETGSLISLSGVTVVIIGTEIEEPIGSGNHQDIISEVFFDMPEYERVLTTNFIGTPKEKELTCGIYDGTDMNFL